MNYYTNTFENPLGPVMATVNEEGSLVELRICSSKSSYDAQNDPQKTAEVEKQIGEYFAGKRNSFDLPLAPKGSQFQDQVWAELLKIPYGSTSTYGTIAKTLGEPNASRAVGRANATNPIWLVIPCHRVIGSSGALTGYAGGIDVKEKLLVLEGAIEPRLL